MLTRTPAEGDLKALLGGAEDQAGDDGTGEEAAEADEVAAAKTSVGALIDHPPRSHSAWHLRETTTGPRTAPQGRSRRLDGPRSSCSAAVLSSVLAGPTLATQGAPAEEPPRAL